MTLQQGHNFLNEKVEVIIQKGWILEPAENMNEDPISLPDLSERQTVAIGAADAVDDHNSDLFFAAIQTTRMPILITDPRQPDNPIIFANPAFVQLTGYSSDEVVGRNCRFLQGPDTDSSTVAYIRDATSKRKEIATEILNYRKDGSAFWNALFVSPVYNRAGELVYFFSSQLDISRRRDAEEALHQAQKMEALGQLTGGIAHDFNNLLQIMSGYVDMLSVGLDNPNFPRARLTQGMEHIRGAIDKATTLTQQLLSFARKQRLEGRTTNLNTLIQSITEVADRTLGDNIEIMSHLDPTLYNCQVDPTQTGAALLNILINARDAMPDGGKVRIETKNVVVTENRPDSLSLHAGTYVCLSVTDTGTGIAPSILSKVMDPFFTTKEEGKGTGLGLSMVYGFAKQSGGTASLESVLGQGTTVRLYFPAVSYEIEPLPQAISKAAKGGHETILVVDDRPEVAEIAQVMLEHAGYTVRLAADTNEALHYVREPGKIDLLVTDLVMPGNLNGFMLANEARKHRPDLKVLVTTGFSQGINDAHRENGKFEVLMKPYRRLDLLKKVRQVLDGPTGVS